MKMFSLWLSVTILSSFVNPLKAQDANVYGCNSSWIFFPNTGIYGGAEQPTVTTVDGCRATCYSNSSCQSIDYNLNNPEGHQCYLLSVTGPKNYFSGVSHWDYNRTAPCAGVCGSWTPFPNTGQYGGVEQPTVTTENDCKSACSNNGSSAGIVWNPGNNAGHQCYLLFGSGIKYSAPGVTLWEYNSTAGCQSPCGTWTSLANTGVYGGIEQPTVTSEYACKMTCEANSTCTGFDWSPNNGAGHQCYLFFWYGTQNNRNGVTHWDFNRTGPCAVDCLYAFTLQMNVGVPGGVEQPNVFNDTDCKMACISNPSCTAIDWNPNNGQSHQCYLQSGTGPKYNWTGVYHYDFNRSACNASGLQTRPPSGGGACYWTESDNKNIYGGSQNPADSVDSCKANCLSTPGCQSIDWAEGNQAGSRCYILMTQQGKTDANWNVIHYDYICPDPPRP